MKKAIIGKKLGMTQIFAENGAVVPVTVIEAGPCQVCQVKTVANDGYSAVQLGFGDIAERKVTNPLKGHFKAANVTNRKHLKEFRLDNAESMSTGDTVAVDTFAVGDKVDITGISKGHGYSGVIKRWNHHKLEMTHGVGPVHREVGSTGANSSPSRVFKNLEMPGQYGNEQVTVLNLEVIKIDTEKNLIAVKGAIPGARNGIVFIRDSVKA